MAIIITDGEKLDNPKFDYEKSNEFLQSAGNAWDIYVAEEEVTERTEQTKEDLMTADISNADYSNVDYIGSPDPNIWEELNRANQNVHVGNSPFPNNCLGCLCGGGSHNNPTYNFSRTYNFTNGGTIHLKTRGSGPQTCTIPSQGGTVVFSASGSTATISLETTRTIRETKIKEAKKTTSQEIDKEELETKEFENETEFEEELNLETIEKEQTEQGLGDTKAEKSQEKELEKEKETETEQEKEQETEKENEQETETEKEKEKEKAIEQTQEQVKEQEKTKEQEKPESEDEYEGESEDEL